MMTDTIAGPAAVQDILLEVVIDASRERVWNALVEQTADWWHKDFYTAPNPVAFRLQPKLGGWMFEDWGDGAGAIWGTVIGVRSPEFLQVAGDSAPEWGGPNRGIFAWKLSEFDGDSSRTMVTFRHSMHGRATDAAHDSLTEGWKLLFEGCLKPFVEEGKRPEAADADAPECNS